MSETPDPDGQEGAEAFDVLLDDDGSSRGEERTFEELPEVEDLTRAMGDRDDEEARALDAGDFDPEAIEDSDLEEDDELDYHAATDAREEELDGLELRDTFDEDQLSPGDIEGLEQVADAEQVEGGEDDFTNFTSKGVDDDDLARLGYAQDRDSRRKG